MRKPGIRTVLVCSALALSYGLGTDGRAEGDSGVKGKLFACADDYFFLYVNDQPALHSKSDRVGAGMDTTLKPGDVIKVRCIDGGDHLNGFGMLFVSDDRNVILCTDLTTWRQYAPRDRHRWWTMDPETVDTWRVYKSRGQAAMMAPQEAEAGVAGGTVIWGAWNDENVYFFRVVTADDLKGK